MGVLSAGSQPGHGRCRRTFVISLGQSSVTQEERTIIGAVESRACVNFMDYIKAKALRQGQVMKSRRRPKALRQGLGTSEEVKKRLASESRWPNIQSSHGDLWLNAAPLAVLTVYKPFTPSFQLLPILQFSKAGCKWDAHIFDRNLFLIAQRIAKLSQVLSHASYTKL